jgi:hypothetical protein
MELRYKQSGTHYIPEYKNKQGEWISITAEDVGMDARNDLSRVCYRLADLSAPRKWDSGQWYYEDSKIVFFTKEIYVMAFLGAAKSFWQTKEVEFKL